MDNSWYIELDHLKLLVDPWLEGVEIDFFSWFNKQWHKTPPISYKEVPSFDYVLITQKYPDHFHKKTLRKLAPKNIIGPSSIKRAVKRLLPDATFHTLNEKNPKLDIEGVTLHFLSTRRKIDPIYDAFFIHSEVESICLATHGFTFDHKHEKQIGLTHPVSLLITPFNFYKLPFFLGGVVSPGLEGVEHLCKVLKPEHVVPTHDEDKHARGIVSKFAKVIPSLSKDELREIPWLMETYQPLNHYHLTKIS